MPSGSSGSVRVFYPEHSKEELVRILSKRMRVLEEKLPLIQVVLFGSYARGDYTVASDVDLLIVYKGEPRSDAFAVCKKTLNVNRLEPHVYAEEEYEAMKETISRMARGGTVLLSGGQGAR